MQHILIHPISALFALTTAFSLAIHDTKIDRMATALVVPSVIAGIAAAEVITRVSEKHVHVEGPITKVRTQLGLQAGLPKVQPRDDERQVIQARKVVYQGGSSTSSLWPSV